MSTRNYFTRRQSGLALQKQAELQRTKKVLQFFTDKTSSDNSNNQNWKAALQGLAHSHKQGIPLHSDQLASIIENAPSFQVAQTIFYKGHVKFDLRWSHKSKISVLKSAANHGRWDFALGFLVKNLTPPPPSSSSSGNKTNLKQLERFPDFPQILAEQTIKSLAKSSNEENSNWSIALATLAVMRNPANWNNENLKNQDIFGSGINKQHQKRQDEETQKQKLLTHSSTSSGHSSLMTIQGQNRQENQTAIYKKIDATPELMQSVMTTLGKASRWVESISVLRAMERQMIPITTPCFENAIRACYSKKKHDEVIAIVKKIMISQNNTLREPVARLTMRSLEASTSQSKSSYGLPSPASPAASHWMTSIQIFRALADQGLALTRQTYESPIRCCVAAGRWESAAKMVSEMRRDGVTAGTGIIEGVLSSKLAYGCRTSGEAWRLFDSLANVSKKSQRTDNFAVIERNTRTYNALLAAAVQDKNHKLVAKILQSMQMNEILHDKETKKWLVRAAYYSQHWERVLKNFLLLRKDVLMEVRGAETFGYEKWPSEYELDDDIARMVMEACEMIGLGDPIARAVGEAVLIAKSSRYDNKNNKSEDQKLLSDSSSALTSNQKHLNDQHILSDLTRRMDILRQKIRREELGEAADLPGSSNNKDGDEASILPKWTSDEEFVLGLDDDDVDDDEVPTRKATIGNSGEDDDVLTSIPEVTKPKMKN